MDELFKDNIYKILELFIQHPSDEFSIRGIARNLNLNHATVIKYIVFLEASGFIKKRQSTLYPTYYADTESKKYLSHKKDWLVSDIMGSGLIETIIKDAMPSSIILFGSCAKATFNENSDIDIFVESKEVRINLSKYEKRLGHKINLLFEQNINDLSKELRNNIINGIILYGFIKVR